jgi:hypothetical protein
MSGTAATNSEPRLSESTLTVSNVEQSALTPERHAPAGSARWASSAVGSMARTSTQRSRYQTRHVVEIHRLGPQCVRSFFCFAMAMLHGFGAGKISECD